jgi:hypothetical protein
MKSLFKSNISWFMLLYLSGILLTNAMEENKTKIKSYSVNQLQNDFIGLKKNPQKYVEFQLNGENTTHPDAGGLYELLPYYQKINPLGEKANYAIQWCDFENKWQLIKVNPLGDLPRLDVEQTTIATLLEGDQFSRPTNADIKAYTIYEQMKSAVKTVGEKNKELKIKIVETEKEISRVQTKAKNEIASTLEKYETKSIEQNQKFKAYAEKANELNEMKNKEYEKALKEIEELKLNLKEKQIQIEKQNQEKRALECQKGDLAYKLSDASEFKQKFLSLEKETKPLKAQIKEWDEKVKHWEVQAGELQKILNKQIAKIQTLTQELNFCKMNREIDTSMFKEYKHAKEKELSSLELNWATDLVKARESIKQDIEILERNIEEKNNIKMKKLKETYDVDKKQLQKEMQKQKLKMITKYDKFKDMESKQGIQIKNLKESLVKLENEKHAEIKIKDAAIQNLERAIDEAKEASRQNIKQFINKLIYYRQTTENLHLSNAIQLKELKNENEKLQILLEMREPESQAYETPKKRLKNNDLSTDSSKNLNLSKKFLNNFE